MMHDLSSISIFSIPCLSKLKHWSLLSRNSPPTLKQVKLVLDSPTLAAGHWDCKDNPDQKGKKRQCFLLVLLLVLHPIQLICVWGSKIDENDMIWPPYPTKQKPKSRKIPESFLTIPRSKIRLNPVPENPGIPGFGKIPSRKIPGLKILIPLGPGDGQCPRKKIMSGVFRGTFVGIFGCFQVKF